MSETSHPSASRRRRLWPRRSELMRPADRIESALLLAVITAALVLLPIALAVGSETYADQTRLGQEQSRTLHPVTATLLRDTRSTSVGAHGETVAGNSSVPARWTAPGGIERTGMVRAKDGLKAGAPVTIWLDDAGNPVTEPITRKQAAMSGAAVAIGLWAVATACLCVVFVLARAGLNRARSAAWQREWARVGPDWSRST